MKNVPMFWNFTRCVLILLCGWQLLAASLDMLMVQRMLRTAQLPSDHHEAMPVSPENIEMMREVLGRRGPVFYYVGLLVVLALSPYARARTAGEREDKQSGARLE